MKKQYQGADRYNAMKDCEKRLDTFCNAIRRLSISLIEATNTIKEISDAIDSDDDNDEIIDAIETIIKEYKE